MQKKDHNNKPIIWTISGSDCSGGAGIAADIKTGHGLGVEVCTLITANTVQNSYELVSVNPVSIDILQQQADVLINDKPPLVIKIGLLVNTEQVQWLTLLLAHYKKQRPNLLSVYDPVGQASVGGNFNVLTLAQLTPLLQQIDVITPNLLEAKTLADNCDELSVKQLAEKIHHDFAITSVLIKGGHSEDQQRSNDYCFHQLNQLSEAKQDNQDKTKTAISYHLSSARINTHYNHGGGCSFATALASFLAQGYLIRDAFTLTKAFINQGLLAAEQVSIANGHQYYGAFEQKTWPRDGQLFPQVIDDLSLTYQSLPPFDALDLGEKKLGLYPVIDSLYWLKRLLPLGLEIIQLRVKNVSPSELEQIISEAINLAKPYKTRIFINDYWQLAIKHGAYGVHIGQEDLCDADLKQIQQAGLRLGISTHGCYEFLLAQQLQPSYLAIGAIFPTKTKNMTGQIQGVDNLQQLLELRPPLSQEKVSEKSVQEKRIPIVAIGGINLAQAPQVLATGVDSIAVVTAITEAENPEQAVDELIKLTF